MKSIKFRENLSKLILQGEKDTTWRLFDDKDLTEGDVLNFLVWETGEEFATAKIIDVKETTFQNLTEEDWAGHEKFVSDEEMYKRYTEYYKREVTPDTKVKIIKFELV
ncbi:MAG: hypothetical protein COV59_03345 [Candidatus Magasanikbacteria bacterium CG11_big_fil_rev_8_21_14_0_20_39_34]|uniref:ASCH domain-containing protein n=1 Tax=Candidatus Magasanikbacteria bacterium CG11_big_fil_rev_8_21_14_0_20_39_34 TaxID=1974653 RepID=A0A2H0N5M3_9BACT|nr:MAG: hypothetical protein COV59_03345 [Candidatus Magasanikbacteria bacterium CG11_big_fil_rev_8_21_14_0_20_39_34]